MVRLYSYLTSSGTYSGQLAHPRILDALNDDYPSYPLNYDSTLASKQPSVDIEQTANPRSQIVSHENPSGGTLILGHASLLTSFVLTEDERYIISADRDEHIRVSWYPQGYVIEMFCLGHKK
jgi:tRNA (guanine-N(7)-)-methyltransferase subunit TRM82